MDANNPFHLARGGSAQAGPARPRLAKTYTPEQQKEMLRDYIEVLPDHWRHVRYGTHVRYESEQGFRPGGFVLRNPFDHTNEAGEKKTFLKLHNTPGPAPQRRGPNYAEWIVAYEDLRRLYAKPDGVAMSLVRHSEARVQKALEVLDENVKTLDRRLRLHAESIRRSASAGEKTLGRGQGEESTSRPSSFHKN